MRAFLAFPLPEKIKMHFNPFIKEAKEAFPGFKWVRAENLHITLFFLGDIDTDTEQWVRNICRSSITENENQRQFHVQFRGIGQFPPKGRPRVVFSPLLAGTDDCMALYNSLFPHLKKRFQLDVRKYTPHITLGRARRRSKQHSLLGYDFRTIPQGEFRIDRIILCRSDLQSSGPVYNEITSFVLPE